MEPGSRRTEKERVVYQSLLEALWVRGLAGQVTPELRRALRKEGLDLNALPASVPVLVYRRGLEVTARHLHPDLSEEDGFREVGRRMAKGSWMTPLSRAVTSCLRLLGPRRSVEWLSRLFRAFDSYSEVRAIREAPGCYRIQVNAPDVPEGYAEALLEEMLREAGARNPRARALGRDAETSSFRVTWEVEENR